MNEKTKFFLEKIREHKDSIASHEASIEALKADLIEVCEHDFAKEDKYSPGNYYDREVFLTIYTCRICGKVIVKRAVGGYG